MKNLITYLVLSFFVILQAFPQQYWERRFKDYQNPDELVTMAETLPFNQAIELLSKVSESTTGRRIVSTVQRTEPIGIEIVNMAYDKALLMIVTYAGLEFETKEDVIVISSKEGPKFEQTADTYAPVTEREVKISAVFFDMDVEDSRKIGMDWEFLLNGTNNDLSGLLRTETELTTPPTVLPPEFNLGASTNFDVGEFSGDVTATFKFFEENGYGEIIASPNITVRDRNKGRIQIGSDFSVITLDFAGNRIEKFFPTGTIIEVTPYIYEEEGINYILLNILVERSTFNLLENSTEIRKTNATSQVLLLNGEQTVIGGLFTNEESVTRNGIPFLKDLPWWVFGIRYLTGSDETVLRKKELVILLKAELVPTLKERFENPKKDHVLGTERDEQRRQIKYHKFDEVHSSGMQ
jgi:type IV pilus assembly protein PilQ